MGWGEPAGALTDALRGCGGLELSAADAQALAGALPAAMGEAFGDGGLELLLVVLSDAGCWWAGPGTLPCPEGKVEFWAESGRWEPTAPMLEGAELWATVARMLGGFMGGLWLQLTGPDAGQLFDFLGDALRDIRQGARWDQRRWDDHEAGLYLSDDPGDPDTMAWLMVRLDYGRLPPDLAERARAWLARYADRCDHGGLPLPAADGLADPLPLGADRRRSGRSSFR